MGSSKETSPGDITSPNAAEAELAQINIGLEERVRERTRQLEAEMERRIAAERTAARSQRMEAIGRLAGGLAHDFNNTLAAVKAFVELAQLKTSTAQAKDYLARALNAIEIGASVNRRLLTFARREPAAHIPATQDAIHGICSVIEHTLGPEFTVDVSVADGLWPARIDRCELECAILNLAIDVREAMPGGGSLAIIAVNATLAPDSAASGASVCGGDFIHVTVKDTGKGMSRTVLNTREAPLFATKGLNDSGPGFDSVRQFISAAQGIMTIDRTQNVGTCVHLYFPRAHDALAPIIQSASEAEVPLGNGETILLVEADPTVLQATSTVLEGLAYCVVCASTARDALHILQDTPHVRAVVSDIVMLDGLSGSELAGHVTARYRGVAVVLASAQPDLAPHADPEMAVLQKPYTRLELANALALALARNAGIDGYGSRTTSPV